MRISKAEQTSNLKIFFDGTLYVIRGLVNILSADHMSVGGEEEILSPLVRTLRTLVGRLHLFRHPKRFG